MLFILADKGVSTLNCTYDALNQRKKKNVSGTVTSFSYGPAGELLYETDGTNAKAYVYLNGVPLARIDNGTTIYYYHTDHLGTPQAMTDSTGTTVWAASYAPFGNATVTTATITNNLRFPGQRCRDRAALQLEPVLRSEDGEVHYE